ncbi:carboxypeptidase-like regulatory domain-containing protein, partial [Parabacteroides sp.]
MKQIVLVISFLLAVTIQSLAATIQGLVKDAQTGEELIGASVFVKEFPQIGSTTGLDGTFVLKNVPDGKTVTLVCSYISYQTHEKSVKTPSSQEVVFEMKPSAMELEGITVIASADKSTDNSARAMEKNSASVLNIVSAKSIEISPDLNVANVLQRVSGVTMQRDNSGEAQYAILRGMDKRYNYTLVNGVKIPSPDNKNRYVPLNIFPSELLDRLEVTKSLTADMEGDATGGAINMVKKDAPNQFSLQANLSTGYSTMFMDRDYARFDRGGVTMTAPREAFGKDYAASIKDFGKGTSSISYKTPLPNVVGGVSLGNRFFDR